MRILGRTAALACMLGLAAGCSDQDPTGVTEQTFDEQHIVAASMVSAQHQLTNGLNLNDLTTTFTDALGNVGTFAGDVEITNLSLNDAGQLVAAGTITGTLTDAAGALIGEVTDLAFETTAMLTGDGGAKCDILFLDLGPIFLDLLGLQIDLSQITLDIDAVPGQGNLLGNLLCGVVKLLDPNSGVLNLLDRISGILNNLGGLELTDVVSTLADGGDFTGDIMLTDLGLNEAGELVATGTLTGTITDAAGGVVGTLEDVAFETTASLIGQGNGGSCQILFLDLGPIFLDLLGLQVDLSPVELEVRGQRGPGNLLGNLLCAVTGLLDPNGGLANLLDRLNDLL